MGQVICLVDDCQQVVKRLGLCYAHYMRQWRYGDPLHRPVPQHADLLGQRFGRLVTVAYERGCRASGQASTWLCRCDCGATTSVRVGDLRSGSVTTCGDHVHHRLPEVGYGAVHDRLRADRGAASSHTCIDCGRPASHWSYDHADADEQYATAIPGHPAFSLKPEHYSPRCVPCHKVFDLAVCS